MGGLFVILPLTAMISRVDWSQFLQLITSPSSLGALRLSLVASTAATVLCLLLGSPMALIFQAVLAARGVAVDLELELDLFPGRSVFYAVKATTVTLYPS